MESEGKSLVNNSLKKLQSYVLELLKLANDHQRQLIQIHIPINTIPKAYAVSVALGLCLESLYARSVDFETFKEHAKGNFWVVRPEYRVDRFSSSTSLASVLFQLHSYDLKNYILRALQISPLILEQHVPISIKLVNDCLELTKSKLTLDDCDAIGNRNFTRFVDLGFANQFKETKSFHDVLDSFSTIIEFVEKNWSYKVLKANKKEIIFSTKESEYIDPQTSFTTELTTRCRFSFLSNMISYKNFGEATITQLAEVQGERREFSFKVEIEPIK